jgi:DNA-binding NarL/FixJ family response regulator
VVDDQERFRRAAAAVIESMTTFDVVGSVATGEESIAAVSELRPDLALMDINLPGIDGLDATRQICLLHPAPVVVLVSTYELTDFGDETSLCGASGYLTKSAFDADSLLEVWDLALV